MSCAKTCGPILTIYTLYDVFPRNDVPFLGVIDNAAHLGVKSPKTYFRGVNRRFQAKRAKYYQNYCIDSKQILNNDKNHQVLFVDGPNLRHMNPRWRTAAIFQ